MPMDYALCLLIQMRSLVVQTLSAGVFLSPFYLRHQQVLKITPALSLGGFDDIHIGLNDLY